MRRFQTPLPCKIGNQHLYENKPIETAFDHQRATSVLSKPVLKHRHNTLILLPNSAEMGTTCCLQLWGKWAWNCSASDKISNNFSSAVIMLPTTTIVCDTFLQALPARPRKLRDIHSLRAVPGTDLQAGMQQGGGFKGLSQSWGIWRSRDPLQHFKGSAVATCSRESTHHWTAIGSLQQNKGKS